MFHEFKLKIKGKKRITMQAETKKSSIQRLSNEYHINTR